VANAPGPRESSHFASWNFSLSPGVEFEGTNLLSKKRQGLRFGVPLTWVAP
jgi:hypothetical protein